MNRAARHLRAGLLAWTAALWLAACGDGGSDGTAPSEPALRHLILITVDTWRQDHFLAERAGVPLTPRLAELAGSALRFTQASSVAAATSSGTSGILTGVLPGRSGVLRNDHVLPVPLPTLGSVLREAGFATAAIVANPVLAPGNGFDKGFESYELVARQPPLRKARAEAVTDRALARLGELRSAERFFLWVHYMDPHGPYQPPAEQLELFPLEAFEAPPDIPLLAESDNSGLRGIPFYQHYGMSPAPRDGRDYLRRYAAEVRYFDHQVGRFLEALREGGVLEDAVLAMTADHGEAMAGEHGYFFSHGNPHSQDQLHVPLLLSCRECGTGAVERPVSTVDVLPTVLALLGVDAPENDGRSLLAERVGPVVSQSSVEITLRDGAWKSRFRGRGKIQLFNLAEDPAEAHDLAESERERLRAFRRQLAAVRRLPLVAESSLRGELSDEERKTLEALGYL